MNLITFFIGLVIGTIIGGVVGMSGSVKYEYRLFSEYIKCLIGKYKQIKQEF